ncbi:hypothetical protein AK812_SmicGene39118 [Symbiodinium microadriaticum]|uniref:Uncharacterized protein n=1 Tax=Symbiodinium microadriaticum TaxID=2951 RepID=A0A1Q9CC08_SYMMI|nr:hypothetical protein AK812_SmicGene39118 [Symbiodinium microadriaticum]
MFDASAAYVDVKVFNCNEVLFHWVFKRYRSDPDLSVQQQSCDEVLIRTASEGWFRRSVVISAFEVRARVYSIAPRGSVVASDHVSSESLFDRRRRATGMTPIAKRQAQEEANRIATMKTLLQKVQSSLPTSGYSGQIT